MLLSARLSPVNGMSYFIYFFAPVISFGLLTHSCNTSAIIECRLDEISSFMSLNRNNVNLWEVFSPQPPCPLEDGEVPDKKKKKNPNEIQRGSMGEEEE